MHGWRSEARVWNNVISELNKNLPEYNFVALDLPAFGSSPNPSIDWFVEDYANIVAEFTTKLKLDNIILVGHSFGGRISIKLLGNPKFADFQSKVTKLILTGSAGFVNGSASVKWKQKIAKIVKPIFEIPLLKPLKNTLGNLSGASDYNARPDLKNIFVNIVSEDLTQEMKAINKPTLLIWGEKDEATPIEYGNRMNQLIRDSKLEIIPDAGHFAFLDNPQQFLETVCKKIKTK